MWLLRSDLCGVNTGHDKKFFYTGFPENRINKDYLLMFFKTAFVYKKDDKMVSCDKYHYILFPPGSSPEHGSCDEGFINDWIFFRGESAKNIIDKLKIPLATPFYINNHSIIESYINKIIYENTMKYMCYEERVSSLIVQMIIDIGRQYKYDSQTRHPAFIALNNARMFMLNNIEKNFSISQIDMQSNYSVSRFCTLYNRFFGVTPVEDLLNKRIEKAVSLLSYGNISVTETATLCGFSSLHYFSRKFKEKTGITPSEYLKM